MKAKINGIYLRMLPNKMRFVRVIDFVTMDSGERGVVFVNREATDEQIQSHSIRYDVLPESKFFETYTPIILTDGDEINVYKGSEFIGTFAVKATEDESVFKCEELDGILFDARIAVGGGIAPIYTPASQQGRYFGIATCGAEQREAAEIINALVKDAEEYINCIKTFPVTAFINMEKLREMKKFQTQKLSESAETLRNAIPLLVSPCGK